jgi:hypothetical protein
LKVKQPALVKKALVTALNKTAAKSTTQFRRELSSKTGIKQKLLRPKVKTYRANRRSLRAKTWMGLANGIPVSGVLKGRNKELPANLRDLVDVPAGKSLSNAFLASMRGGAATLYVREGRARFPVKALKLNLEKIAPGLIEQVGDRVAGAEFRREFERDMVRRLNKVGTAR